MYVRVLIVIISQQVLLPTIIYFNVMQYLDFSGKRRRIKLSPNARDVHSSVPACMELGTVCATGGSGMSVGVIS